MFFMIFIIILIPLLILSIILSYFFVIPFFYGAPYEPSRGKALKNIIKFTAPKSGDKIAELGSGDGRVCIVLAKKLSKNSKIEIHGFEINPFLVWISRRKIKKLKLQNKIKIYWKNFWKINLHNYNKIVMFQFSTITNKLSIKFKRELKPGSIIISHWWKLPNWKIKKRIGRIYLYQI
mgnify:FL=1